MNLSNFGRQQLEQGLLNNMLEKAGIDDVGSFVQQFRNEANFEAAASAQQHGSDEEDEDISLRTASNQQANLFSMGGSLLNKVLE